MLDETIIAKAMRRLFLFAALLTISGGLISGEAFAQSPAPPNFTVEMVPVDSTGLPPIQSYAWAQSGGKWLIFGGRTQGLHLFVESTNGGTTPPPNAFTQPNTSAWVIDPVAKKAWSSPLSQLPTTCTGGQTTYICADPLSATNQESIQDGDVLYIIGGYGMDNKAGQMTTFGTVSAIKVKETINAIVNGQPIVPFIQQTSTYYDCTKQSGAAQDKCIQNVQKGNTQGIPTNTGYYARVTGGDVQKLGNIFYLVFGQQFEGLYSTLEGDYGKWPVKQVYTNRIAALNLTPEPLTASVLYVILGEPNLQAQYHRRDLNVLATLDKSGKERITIHGGVFVPGRNSAYRQPIFIDQVASTNKVKVTVDQKYQQFMSQYDCANLRMFDRTKSNMITVFFGGISLYYLDQKLNQLKLDEGLPFIDDVTAMTLNANGTWSEFVRAAPMDGYLGTDAKFIPDPSLTSASNTASGNGVIYLDALKGRTPVGYFYGGILAERSEAGDPTGKYSHATNALYQVYVTPVTPPQTYWIPANPNDPSQIPASDKGGVNTRRKSQ
jgi:hypothetical protein